MSHVQKMLSKRNPGYDGAKKYPDVLERISLHAEIKVSKCKDVLKKIKK